VGSDFDIVDSIEEFLRGQGDDPWFLYAHLMDVHQYAADEHSSIFGTGYEDVYDNSIHFIDRAVSRMISHLDDRDLRKNTIVVVLSDHGEAFGEHGFEGHARDLHAEVTRTPWIISLPFRLPSPVVVGDPTQNVDVWPTLMELLGIDYAAEDFDGRSVVPEVFSSLNADPDAEVGVSDPRSRISHLDRHWGQTGRSPLSLVTVAEGDFRLLHAPELDQLYETSTDRQERSNVLADREAVGRRLRAEVDAYLEVTPAWRGGVPSVELNDMELGHLRALGYVVEQ
jgi:arylsulfatase A-like enzyme